MSDLIREIENGHMKKDIPDFRPGDTVRVGVRITEGTGNEQRTRVQPFEGVVMGRSKGGLSESFAVRRVTHGVGVERTFPLHSPSVGEIKVIKSSKVRRAKLFYLRKKTGKAARLTEKKTATESAAKE